MILTKSTSGIGISELGWNIPALKGTLNELLLFTRMLMTLNDLQIYQLSRELCSLVWDLYDKLSWQDKKVMGDQWLTSTDSVGANIAEGFGRFHYKDKNKFNYNARGSLLEAFKHWTELMYERKKISKEAYDQLQSKFSLLHIKLNAYIASTNKQVMSN
jgi:four helix bundle protein